MKYSPYPIFSLVLCFFANTAAVAANFGAIAYDLETNAYGVSWDQPSQALAYQNALFQCSKHGNNCEVVTRFVDQCGAYAVGPAQIWGSGYGGSRVVAERAALFYCNQHGQGCAIKVWGCNSQPYSGGTWNNGTTQQNPDRDANRRRAEESRSWGGQEQYDRICRESGGCN